jgi:hypothetical protein
MVDGTCGCVEHPDRDWLDASTTTGLTPTQHNLARPSSSIRHDSAATHRDGIPLPNPNSVPDSTQDSRSVTIRFRPRGARPKLRDGDVPACARGRLAGDVGALRHNAVYAARLEHLTTLVSSSSRRPAWVALAAVKARHKEEQREMRRPPDSCGP